MKHLNIKPGLLRTTVHIPSSKSYANRALVLASLVKKSFTLKNLPESTDVTHLVAALKNLHLKMEEGENSLTVLNSFPDCETSSKEIYVGEGGTTARFLAGLLTRGQEVYTLVLGNRLKDRPWEEFIQFVQDFGGEASLHENKLFIKGPLKLPSEVKMDCSRSTQFATAIQLAYPEVKVTPVNLESSQSYWEMTVSLVKNSLSSNEYDVPLDWSSASYPMAFAALNQRIHFPGLFPDTLQADSKFYGLLKDLGAIQDTADGLTVTPLTIKKSVTIDVSDCLDLVPTLGYFLSHIPGQHKLLNVSNLVHKESDRLNEVIKLLEIFEREAKLIGNDLVIDGHEDRVFSPRTLEMPDDHRMVMSGTLFLLHHWGGKISPLEAVNKSYPNFFELIQD